MRDPGALRTIYWTAGECDAGKSVEFLLRRRLGVSDAYLRHFKYVEGSVVLDGRPSRCDARVAAGQTVGVVVDDYLEPHDPSVTPEDAELDIAFEDDDLLVVNKPAGLVVHPSPGHWEHTLGNYVVGYLTRRRKAIDLHPVNRLDIGTSGLVVFATSGYVQLRMQGQLHTGAFSREYLALCQGCDLADEGEVDAPIARMTSSPSSFGVHESGKRAKSRYKVVRRYEEAGLCLVRLELETGRTHQIRVHMAHIGHPLAGDVLYGGANQLPRPALHSWRLDLDHPVTRGRLALEAPLSHDIGSLLPENPDPYLQA